MKRLLAGACALLLCASAYSQSGQSNPSEFPNKTVRIVVGGAPGGGSDIIGRLLAKKLTDLWGASTIVENRSAGAVFGLDAAAKAAPDGYMIGFAPNSGYSAAVLSIKLPFDLRKDLDPLVQLTSQSYLMLVNPSVPAQTVKDLIDYAKAKPGVLNYASTGHGTSSHLGMELFNLQAGIKSVHVPFKGAGPAYVGMLGGQVQVFIGSIISSIQFVKSGKMRALAVTSDKRNKQMPDVPTVTESGLPGFEMTGWYGLVGPSGLPPAVNAKIYQTVTRALGDRELAEKIASDGSEVVNTSQAEFRKLVSADIDRWEKFGKATGIRLD